MDHREERVTIARIASVPKFLLLISHKTFLKLLTRKEKEEREVASHALLLTWLPAELCVE